jgi:hypothetical protein
MKVTHIYVDGTRYTQEMGCFGACGRADSRGVRPALKHEAEKFSSDRGLGLQDSWECASLYKKPVQYIALSEGFLNLFHVNNQQIMQYLIDDSPYKICFDQPYAEVFKQNEVRVLATGIPSEVTMSCLFMLRRIAHAQTAMNTTFCTLIEHCTPWMALITTRMFPLLGLGNVGQEFQYSGDGSFFYEYFTKALVRTDDPFSMMDLSPWSVDELGGYIMNIRRMWYISTDSKRNTIGTTHVMSVAANYSKPTKIQGIFGEFTTQQVTDIPAFLNDLWGTE